MIKRQYKGSKQGGAKLPYEDVVFAGNTNWDLNDFNPVEHLQLPKKFNQLAKLIYGNNIRPSLISRNEGEREIFDAGSEGIVASLQLVLQKQSMDIG